MYLEFDADDQDRFEELVGEVADRLLAAGSLSARPDTVHHHVHSILEGKRAVSDDMGYWTPDIVDEIFLHWYPAKVMADPGDYDEILEVGAAVLRLFGSQLLVAPDLAETLASALDRATPAFAAAMSDRDSWSFGKRLWSTAESEGVDFEDQASVEAFMTSFNSRSMAERDAVLGALPAAMPGNSGFGPLPAVRLESLAELARQAAAVPMVVRMQKLVEFVGDRLALTQTGRIKLADARRLIDILDTEDEMDQVIGDRTFNTKSSGELTDLDLTFEIAVASDVLMIEGKYAKPSFQITPETDTEILNHALMVATSLLKVGPAQHLNRQDHYGFDWFAQDLDESLMVMLIGLYRNGPAEIEFLLDGCWDQLMNTFDFDDVQASKLEFHERLVVSAYRYALKRLEQVGVVAVKDVVETESEYGSTDSSGGSVELTPFGLWMVNQIVSESGEAPVIGELRDASAGDMLKQAADMAESMARVEIAEWLAARKNGAAELVEAMAAVGSTERSLAYKILVAIGPAAEPDVSAMAGHPDLAPIVTLFRVDTQLASPEETDVGSDADRFVTLMAAAIEMWGPETAASGWVVPLTRTIGPIKMLDTVWRVRRPETEVVLTAIGEARIDKAVSKAARKALFKHRSPS